jgi:hypothetical protein
LTGWRDLDDVRQPLPLDDWTADRLLAGMVDPDDAPPGYTGLARALGQARGPVEAGDLAGRELIVAAVTAAVADASPPTISTLPRRKSMLAKMFGTKLAAATLTTALLATGAAAATGSLPGPVQDAVSDVADRVGVTLPVGDAEDATPASSQGKDAHETRDGRADERDAAKAARAETEAEDGDGGDASDPATDLPLAPEVVDPQAENGIPTSLQGQHAHEVRDMRHSDDPAVAEGWKALRDSYHPEKNDSDPAGDEDDGTPASEQGTEAHAERDARLAENDTAKAARDDEKAQRPADEGDEAGDADEADDDADEADEDDSDDDADEDEDGKGDDDSDDDADEDDDAPADPAV